MLRNKEFKKFAFVFIIIAALFIITGFIINTKTGILVSLFTFILGIVFYVFTKARYKSIAQISNEIDLVLHNVDHMYIGESEEGELSILHSEITKMMLRIREQNDALKKEKKFLESSLADIAHQLRTPLTSVNLILTLIDNSTDDEERRGFVRETEELLIRMDWLITSLLKLSRLDAGIIVFQREQIDVNNLISVSVRPFLIQFELHNIELNIDVPKGIIIHGDQIWLSEAIQNIIKNCIESSGENGRIELKCMDNQLFTEITVHDSGTGFKQEDIPHLFDRFYRGKDSSAAGVGIGLSLCKMIIIRVGGTITAKNHVNGGALFNIRFPK